MEPNGNRTFSVPVPSVPVLGNFGSVLGSRYILPTPMVHYAERPGMPLRRRSERESLFIRVERNPICGYWVSKNAPRGIVGSTSLDHIFNISNKLVQHVIR